jgi:hypothetical protein
MNNLKLAESQGIKLVKRESEINIVKEVFLGNQELADEIMNLEDI